MKRILICADASLYRLPPDNFANYVAAFENLGAEVVLSADRDIAMSCDALLLPGGEDVHPSRYGQPVDERCFVHPDRDAAEFDMLDLFVKAAKPVIGICRGEQLINVYFGGTLHQHVDGHGRVGDPPRDSVHNVRADDALLCGLYGERFAVNSAHHQVIDRLGSGLRAIAYNDDGYVEGVRHESLPVYAVQWHPERMCFAHARPDTVDGSRLLGALCQSVTAVQFSTGESSSRRS